MYNIGIDLGGTNIKVGIVNEKYEIVSNASVKTNLPRPAEGIVDGICEATEIALKGANLTINDINAVGIGTPGSANRETGEVLYSNNLGFRNVHLGTMLKERLGKNVYVENDANAAAFGEYLAGGGKGYENVVVITLGTGVGGGVIIDGKIYTGFNFCIMEDPAPAAEKAALKPIPAQPHLFLPPKEQWSRIKAARCGKLRVPLKM